MALRQKDSKEPLLCQSGDLVLQQNVRRKGEDPKFQSKFVGFYKVVTVFNNHTYLLEN